MKLRHPDAARQISRAAIIGAGQMGLGIAYVTALHAKVPLTLHDPSPSVLSSSLKRLDKLFERDVEKARISREEAEAARARITGRQGDGTEGGLEGEDVDLVIEAIPEIPDLKIKLFSRLSALLPPPTILGSNTSSISLTRLAAAASREEGQSLTNTNEGNAQAGRVVGIHFFNPVPQMKLVEVIPALQTSPETLERAREFGKACGKEVTTSADSPGFIANAILMPMINEAIIVLEKGIATKEDIDTTFRLGMAHPMGPLALADLIGLDTCLHIQRVLLQETGDTKYRPAGLLVRMVDAGWVGRKVGKGFYEYDQVR
ncbi:putative 3-hydroxybutyryl-CoA dehydrogenase [Naematelia encephala]|uniref:Putative 3-hydroxybutyryl-CoA dehydrogenase n=1 Tax=Naematelia encephala TaxID=71784 RepID=A0A1Y2B9S5_9TREE|nr:putative 3-hydroxybutyryl-CoA dehydrogenase [Naematelia encephala]